MKYLKSFSDNAYNTDLLGGKGTNLIRLFHNNYNVPFGFILTTRAHKDFMRTSKDHEQLLKLISKDIQPKKVLSLSNKIQKIILNSKIPFKIIKEIENVYKNLNNTNKFKGFAVRSSATIEDSEIASFAGQADSYLFRKTLEDILLSVKKCWSSLYSPRSLLYIAQMNKMGKSFSLDQIYMAVIIQEMIDSEISGVLFTANVLNNNLDQMLINSAYGLGEALANNKIIPDTIIIDKKTCEIIKQIIGKKEKMMVPDFDNSCTKLIHTRKDMRNDICLSSKQIKQLHQQGINIEKLFEYPQDIEWAIKDADVYILQTRPITTLKS